MSLQINQNITLDFLIPKIKNVRVVEGDRDSRIINITVTNNGTKYYLDKNTMIARYKIHKPDNKYIYNNIEINDDGTITIQLTNQATIVDGICNAELQITDLSGNILSTMPFNIIVEKSVVSDDDIISQSESTVIEDLTNHLIDYDNPHRMPDATTEIKGITKLTDSINSTSTTTAATPNSVKSVKDSLNSEINRATSAENTLTTNLSSEISRAKSAESTLTTNLNNEIARAKGAETTNANAISSETTRATTKENEIASNLSSHTSHTSNPHSVTKAQVGLGNVENKSSATIRGEITKSNVTTALGYTPLNQSLKGSASGLAELDSNGKVPSSQLPSFVDDVVEGYLSGGKFYKESAHTTEISGETGKIYIDLSTEKTYRWSGSAFVVISETLALGETSSTAYRGDRGKTAYDHSQSTHARTDATKVESSATNGNIKINGTETTVYTHPSGTNPHGTTKSDVGLGNVGNFKAVSTVASQGLSDTEKANARANIGAGTSSFSGSYNDLTNKPTIPTVGNGTITITQNGTTKGTFTTNQSGNTTIALTDNNTTYGVATQSANGLESAADKTKLDGIATGAEVNQNAFSNVVVGTTTIAADSKTDTLTLAGSNVTLTPDTTNDKVTIGITKDNVISALGYTPGSSVDSDTNIDTKVTQTVTTSNASYPLLLAPRGQTETATTTSYFDSGVTLNPSTNTITTNISGNSATATKLATARTIALTGSVTGSGTFDGSGNLSITTTTNHTHSYLPLSGGTMTGDIKRNGNAVVNTGTDGSTNFSGGTDLNNGANLVLRGKDQKGIEGLFQLTAQNGSASTCLIGKPDGTLTWGGTTLLRSDNWSNYCAAKSHTHDYASSNHTHSYLPLSGGTLTGQLNCNSNITSDGYINCKALNLFEATTELKYATIGAVQRSSDKTYYAHLTLGSNYGKVVDSCLTMYDKGGYYNRIYPNSTTGNKNIYLPSTGGTLTTSAGKSATYTSSLSSGSDTLFTQAGAYAMYSELNSNLAPLNATISINTDYVKLHPYGNNVCRKIGNMIFITGIVIAIKQIPNNTNIFTLPVGYHPSEFSIINGLRTFNFSAQTNCEAIQLNFNTDGTVIYYGTGIPADSTFTINGVIFAQN